MIHPVKVAAVLVAVGCAAEPPTLEVAATDIACGLTSANPTLIPPPPPERPLVFDVHPHVRVLYMHPTHANAPIPDCPTWLEPAIDCYEPPSHVPEGQYDLVPDFIEDLAKAAEEAYLDYEDQGYPMRPPALGKVIVDATRVLSTDPNELVYGIAYPGDLVLINPKPLFVDHLLRQQVLRQTAAHEMFHLAQFRGYHPVEWPQDGSGWLDPAFDPAREHGWLAEATATHMAALSWPDRKWGHYDAALLARSGIAAASRSAFPFFTFLETSRPDLQIVRRFHGPIGPWFHFTQLPTTPLEDRALYNRIVELLPDPGARLSMWQDFTYAFNYSHDPSAIAGMDLWGPRVHANAQELSGFERKAPLPGEQQPLLARTQPLDRPFVTLAQPGRIATWVIGVKAALCVGAPKCNGGVAIPDADDYQLVLEVPIPEHAYLRVSRAPNAHGQNYPAPAETLFEAAGPRTVDQPVIIELASLHEGDQLVITVVRDSEAPPTSSLPTQVLAYFQAPATELALHGKVLYVLRRDGTLLCRGNDPYGMCNDGGIFPRLTPIVDEQGVPLKIQTLYPAGWTMCGKTFSDGIKCWGLNLGALGNGTATTETHPSTNHAYHGADAIGLARHGCKVDDGVVSCSGPNEAGELGNGTTSTTYTTTHVVIPAPSTTSSFALGGNGTCAVTAGGSVSCWGYNRIDGVPGLLGTGSSSPNVLSPQSVIGVSGVTQMSKDFNSAARRIDGRVQTWGTKHRADRGCGDNTSPFMNACFVREGSDDLRDVEEVVDTCARKTDGTAWCWGTNQNSMLGNGAPWPTSCHPSCMPFANMPMPPASCQPVCFSSTARPVVGLTGVTRLASQPYIRCALAHGVPYCWGNVGVLNGGTTGPWGVATPMRID